MSFLKKYWHDEVGYNFRMTNMQAAIGLAQLEQASFFVKKRLKFKKILSQIEKLKRDLFS